MHIRRGGIAAMLVLALLATPAAALDSLRFRAPGASEDVADALAAASLLIAARRDGVTAPVDLLAAARAEYARILGALYGQGHYGGTVSIRIDGREAAGIDPLQAPDRIDRIEVLVRPGPAYRFARAEIAPLAGGTDLPEGFAPGARARSGQVQAAVDAGVAGWRSAGHAQAALDGQRLIANHPDRTLDAQLALAPGPRLRFGALHIEGQSRVREARIRKIAGLPIGERFDPEALDRSTRRLRDTGVFRSVSLREAETPNPDGTLDVTARVQDLPKRRFGLGAALESTDGVTLSGFWLHRNLLRGAERLRLDFEVRGIGGATGGVDYETNAEITRPATPDARTSASLAFRLAALDEPDFTEDTLSLGLSFNRQLTDTLSVGAGVAYRFSDVTDDVGSTEYRQLFLPLRTTWDRRDGPLDTVDGHYIHAGLSPFQGFGGSDSGARFELDARGYKSLGAGTDTVLAARIQAGSIFGTGHTGLPNELRFFSGGGGTVRGQEYQSLGADLNSSSGGANFLGLQAELRRRVTDTISLVGFYDWGYVGLDSLPGSGGASHAGAGLGLRYETGIGPIRVDLGLPVSGADTGESFQLYIGIGQAF